MCFFKIKNIFNVEMLKCPLTCNKLFPKKNYVEEPNKKWHNFFSPPALLVKQSPSFNCGENKVTKDDHFGKVSKDIAVEQFYSIIINYYKLKNFNW